LPKLKKVSGIDCNKFGFKIRGRSGSHVRLSKITSEGKVGTVVPMHKELNNRHAERGAEIGES